MKNYASELTNEEHDDEKNVIWERNHQKILDAIASAIKYAGTSLPTITQVARLTGLSRATIRQHIKSFSSHPAYKERMDMYEAIQSELVLKICKWAMQGNLQAAKMYMELTGKIKTKDNVTNTLSGNYVQINGMVFNQQIMETLSPEHLRKIEDVIKSAYHAQPPSELKNVG